MSGWLPGWQQTLRHWFTYFETTSAFHVDYIFVRAQHRDWWQEMVSLCSLIWPRPASVSLFSIKLPGSNSRYSESHVSSCGRSGRLLTHHHPCELRNWLNRYRKNPYRLLIEIFISIYIDYIDNLRQPAPQTVMGFCNSQVKHPKYDHYYSHGLNGVWNFRVW